MKHVLIEGWRGISQSYAMVNQYQLLELGAMPGFSLQHRDLPFRYPNWNVTANDPGFPTEVRAKIEAIPPPDRDSYDCIYRIASPYGVSDHHARRVLTFMTGEFGVTMAHFAVAQEDLGVFYRGGNRIVTPSSWSKMKLVEFGFPEDTVAVVPHGVNPSMFSPLPAAEVAATRERLGFGADDFIFLNLGAMTWNKGVDVLVRAFAAVRQRDRRARLVLKDDNKLYGIAGAEVVRKALEKMPAGVTDDLRSAIVLISDTLTSGQLRALYAIADRYVSPYRAEGFNLPVIEAIACGTPAIVTAGGATDDYCNDMTAVRVTSRRVENAVRGIPGTGFHLEPDDEELVERMHRAMTAPLDAAAFDRGRQSLIADWSWAACTRKLAEHFFGDPAR